MEEYNQCFKELNIFLGFFMRQGNTKGLGDKTKTVPAFAVISPERPLKLFFLNFASLMSSAFFIGWTNFQKCPSTVISTFSRWF